MRTLPVIGLLLLAAPAFAQDAAPAPEKPKEDRKICRSVAMTGSILGGRRECHTKAEWDLITRQSEAFRDKRERDMRGRNGGVGITRQ